MKNLRNSSAAMNLREWGYLGGCDGIAKMDLATYLVTIPNDPPDVLNYHMTHAHECSHWVRFHSSTVGVASTLAKYASERMVVDFLGKLDRSEREEVVQVRRSGKPIFSLDDLLLTGSDELRLTRQLWMDAFIGNRLMFDFDAAGACAWDHVAAVGSALTDANWWAHSLFSADTVSLRSQIQLVQLSETANLTVYQAGGEMISTRLLYECAATIDQYLAWGMNLEIDTNDSGLGAGGQYFASHAEASLSSSYGAPLRAYEHITQGSASERVRSMITVAILIDIALNPRIPPFLPEGSRITLDWDEVYPPTRFLRACAAASVVGPVPKLLSDSELVEYVESICQAAGLSNPYRRDGIFFGQLLTPTIEEQKFSFSGTGVGSSPADEYIAYLAWVQRRLWRLKEKFPTLVTFYGANHISQSREAVGYLIGDEGLGWFDPPFYWTTDGRYMTTIDSDTSSQYAASLALNLTLHELVTGTGSFTTHWLPPDSVDRPFWSEVRNKIEALFDCRIWD